jgi:hypothetical protein
MASKDTRELRIVDQTASLFDRRGTLGARLSHSQSNATTAPMNIAPSLQGLTFGHPKEPAARTERAELARRPRLASHGVDIRTFCARADLCS